MDQSLRLSSSSSSELITVSTATLSSSTTSDLITVSSSMTAPVDPSDDDENDESLRELIDQRKRLVAELAAAGEMDIDDVLLPDGLESGELADDDDDGCDSISKADAADPMDGENMDANGIDEGQTGDGETAGAGVHDGGDDEEDGEINTSEEEQEFDDEELDKLLEEPLANGQRGPLCGAPKMVDDKFSGLSQPPAVKAKVVLKHRGMEYFEVLPDGWIEVTHGSGIPVYLHKSTRVCTLARPYFLGPGSVRNHDVPISAVPCYHQRKIKELEAEREKQKEATVDNSESSGVVDEADLGPPNPKKLKTPTVKVQTLEDFKDRNMNPGQLHDYCSRVFEFETINVIRFKSWSDHRAYRKRQRQQQLMCSTPNTPTESKNRCPVQNGVTTHGGATERPSLPANVKLITVPDMEKGAKPQQKPFFLNPQGRTSIAVLHEYVQKVMKGKS